jgi:hypothetical protein
LREDISLAIIKSIVDSQKDLIAIFCGDEIILVNKAFENFFSVSSIMQYKESFGPFVNNFVPHPNYFNAEKINDNQNWFDAILELDPANRLVSMMTQNYEPRAFSVKIDKIEEYTIAVFCDITQTLVKRIMIENRTNIDANSGAYTKNYFLQVAQNYEDAAIFNGKIISTITIHSPDIKNNSAALKSTALHFKSLIRQDDMLIRWTDDTFLLIYMVDDIKNSQIILNKIKNSQKSKDIETLEYIFSLTTQNNNENIDAFLRRVK